MAFTNFFLNDRDLYLQYLSQRQRSQSMGSIDRELAFSFLTAYILRQQLQQRQTVRVIPCIGIPRQYNLKGKECSICYESLSADLPPGEEEKTPTCIVPCEHIFHKACILTWLKQPDRRVKTCPNCRATVNSYGYVTEYIL